MLYGTLWSCQISYSLFPPKNAQTFWCMFLARSFLHAASVQYCCRCTGENIGKAVGFHVCWVDWCKAGLMLDEFHALHGNYDVPCIFIWFGHSFKVSWLLEFKLGKTHCKARSSKCRSPCEQHTCHIFKVLSVWFKLVRCPVGKSCIEVLMCMFPSLFGADHLKMIRGQHCELEGRIVLCNSSGNSKKTFMFEKRSASVLSFKPCRFAATRSSIVTANQFEQTKLQPHGSFALALCGQVRVISLHRDWPQGIYNIQSILPGNQCHSEVYLRKKTLLDPSKTELEPSKMVWTIEKI